MLKEQKVYIHEGIYSQYDESEVVIFGVPFDGTVSFRPGTRFGPSAIRQELDGLEVYSPYLERELHDYKICDLGDLHLPFGNTQKVMELIEKETNEILKDRKKTLALGGEHLISYPIIKSYIHEYPNIHIIHFDAHADLRDDYLGEKLSHATVMKRVHENLVDGTLWQFGIRSGTKEEFCFNKKNVYTHKFSLVGLENAIKQIGNAPVYITIDLDVLDPSIFSGTGTPEPGGITFNELIQGLLKLKDLNTVGGDIVELSPHYDQSGVSTAVACKVLRELALILV